MFHVWSESRMFEECLLDLLVEDDAFVRFFFRGSDMFCILTSLNFPKKILSLQIESDDLTRLSPLNVEDVC